MARPPRNRSTELAEEVELLAWMDEAYGHFQVDMPPRQTYRHKLDRILADHPELASIAEAARQDVRARHRGQRGVYDPGDTRRRHRHLGRLAARRRVLAAI